MVPSSTYNHRATTLHYAVTPQTQSTNCLPTCHLRITTIDTGHKSVDHLTNISTTTPGLSICNYYSCNWPAGWQPNNSSCYTVHYIHKVHHMHTPSEQHIPILLPEQHKPCPQEHQILAPVLQKYQPCIINLTQTALHAQTTMQTCIQHHETMPQLDLSHLKAKVKYLSHPSISMWPLLQYLTKCTKQTKNQCQCHHHSSTK